MSLCTRRTCPHDRGVFIWLGDGPWLGDPADPDYGRYAWVHDTTMTPGHLVVCQLMSFATPEEAGELCACGCPSHVHRWNPGPIGHEYKPHPCPCGCPDFRHRPEDLARYWERERARRPVIGVAVPAKPRAAAAAPVPARAVQLDLFGSAA